MRIPSVLRSVLLPIVAAVTVACSATSPTPPPTEPPTSQADEGAGREDDQTQIASTAVVEDCEAPGDGWSIARRWNEVALAAIRRDFPAPTVHARNLYHLSAAMWDAWAAYDADATSNLVELEADHPDIAAARDAAISYAAHGVLRHRYATAIGADETLTQIDATLRTLCHDPDAPVTADGGPVAVGRLIAGQVIAAGVVDGALEGRGYEDPTYEPVNPPLVLVESGTRIDRPNRWQPLAFDRQESQNGLLIPDQIQTFVGPHWGDVRPFALPPSEEGLPIDPGPPPLLGDPDSDAAFKEAALEVIRYSSLLDPESTELIDISPRSTGDVRLGTYDVRGRDMNPVTGEAYEPHFVAHADYGRVVAEFWADGPDSETPPGHWNALANQVGDDLAAVGDLRIGGEGPPVGRLEWDVKLYLALNGANHDAAIAAWGAKARYDYGRPISFIRHMGQSGQSTDSDGPSYHPDGLPLADGLVEVVTQESSAPGQRHAHLSDRVGAVTVRSWAAYPRNPLTEAAGVDWILAEEWVPYQKRTFVTPAFAGYVSGHSTFSRASAEVLSAFTGSPYFPGGLGTWTVPAEHLEFEAGPASDVVLQWATYGDAADQAGLSRLYGGIHVRADDLDGRRVGEQVGKTSWARARQLFG